MENLVSTPASEVGVLGKKLKFNEVKSSQMEEEEESELMMIMTIR